MQIQVKDIEQEQKVKVFHPFVLELKIESEQDLKSLVVYFNQNYQVLNSSTSSYKGYKAESLDVIWGEVDRLLNCKPYMK